MVEPACYWCGESSQDAQECQFCRLTSTCETHREFHRQLAAIPKGGGCLKVAVREKPGVGRFLVALTDIKAGEVIFRDTPMVWGTK